MRITLAVVMSLNGKITKGADGPAHGWASAEDWKEFRQLRSQADALVLDSRTYRAMQLNPVPGLRRIVLTRDPQAYAGKAVPGQLEFSALSPVELVAGLRAAGHKQVLLAGGRRTSLAFLQAGLVDDLYLTLEPFIFGKGKAMLAEGDLDLTLKLLDSRLLNDQGTIMLHYAIDAAPANSVGLDKRGHSHAA